MKRVNIGFCDFWQDFDPEDNFFVKIISRKYDVRVSDRPDILIYSNRGRTFLKHNCIKIFYNGENVRPDYDLCDFSFSFEYGGEPKNYRLPLYALYDDVNKLTAPKNVDEIVSQKTKFCNFIYSNPKPKERIQFFELLGKYKRIDSAGKVLNNVGYPIGKLPRDKWDFISEYKFTISFESASFPGYTTEKIFEPMLVNSLPIYWGNPEVERDFNGFSFVNGHNFPSFEQLAEHIIKIDKDEELYRKYLVEPYFHNNRVPQNLLEESILKQFDYIIGLIGVARPVALSFNGIKRRYSELVDPYLKKAMRILKNHSNV